MNNKEELEKEAEEWLCNNLHSASEEDFIKAMIDIAEPREKQIAELSKHIVELQNDKGELIDRCRELEAQIEKMKNCGNCKNYSPTYGLCCYSLGDEDYDCRLRKWEIKEK